MTEVNGKRISTGRLEPATTTATTTMLNQLLVVIAAKEADALKRLLTESSPGSGVHLVNARNERNWTPLHFAARYGFLDGVRILMEAGARPDLRNDSNKTAIELAREWEFHDCAEAMFELQSATTATSTTIPPSPAATTATSTSSSTPVGNFFSGNPLNRRSEWRDKPEILLSKLDSAKILLFNRLRTVIKGRAIVWHTRSEIEAGLPDSLKLSDIVSAYNEKDSSPQDKKSQYPILVFLGEDENQIHYWALDTANLPDLVKQIEATGHAFIETRPAAFSLPKHEASIVAHGRSMIDWNSRNQFCPMCGMQTRSSQAGHKRVCGPNCQQSASVHNVSYPRTDAVVIVCIVHPDGDKCLLGRQKSWPPSVYSCIAGFIEPGETLEEAAQREAFEETSVSLAPGRVFYHSSQPWPFPSQLMVGMIGEASPTVAGTTTADEIHLVDGELEDARWFTRDEVIAAFNGPEPNWGSGGSRGGNADNAQQKPPVGNLILPAKYAIARTIIKAWAEQTFKFPVTSKF